MDTLKEAIEAINGNPELLAAVVTKDGMLDPELLAKAVAALSVRGDFLVMLGRKSTFSTEAKSVFTDAVFSLAADMVSGITATGTSKQHRFTGDTPSGKVTFLVEPIK